MKKISAVLLCVLMLFAVAIPVFAGSADDVIKAAALELGAEFIPGEINNAIQMRGFTASPDGQYVYGGFLQGGRYVVRFNTSDNSQAGNYKPAYTTDNELYCKGLAVDDRGILFIGVTHSGHSDVGVVAVGADMKEIGRKVDDLGKPNVGINGVAVQKILGKYKLFAVTAYDVDSVRCYDVTDPENITLDTNFGVNGVMDCKSITGADEDPSYIAVDENGYIYLTCLKSSSGYKKGSHVAKISWDGMTLIKEVEVPYAYGICEAGDYVFVATYNKANSCVAVLNKEDLSSVATLKYANQATDLSDIAYGGDTLFVGDHGNGGSNGGAYYKAKIELPEGLPGDINKDGAVNNKDVVALFNHVSGGDAEVDEVACDCNNDKQVNNKDVVTLFKYVSGGAILVFYNGKASELPDKKLTYTSAVVYASKNLADKYELEAPTNNDVATWYCESVEFDDSFEIKLPDEMAYVENFIVRSAIGKYIEEINVLKVKDASNIAAVKAMVEAHAKRQNDNKDYSLYNDDGRNGKMIDTGKVETYGNFVIYTCTLDSSLSMLRAQKYIAENPAADSYDVFRFIVSELYE